MLRKIKRVIKYLIPQLSIFQSFYRALYYVGIWGMNYGVEGKINQTGEQKALKKIKGLWNTENPTLFDVGANIGDYSNFLTSLLSSKGKIYAFEPIKSTFDRLQSNVKSPMIHPINYALSDREGVETIYFDSTKPSQASLIKLDIGHLNLKNEDKESINLTTMDMFCAKNNIEKIDLLKIDVEGNELKVLHGASHLLKNNRIKTIQFEFGITQIDAHVFFKDFWKLLHNDFRIYRILRGNLHEIKSYTESLEVFHFSNFIAIHKTLEEF